MDPVLVPTLIQISPVDGSWSEPRLLAPKRQWTVVADVQAVVEHVAPKAYADGVLDDRPKLSPLMVT